MGRTYLLLEPFKTEKKSPNEKDFDFSVSLLTYASALVRKTAGYRLKSLSSLPLGLAQISSIAKECGANTEHIPFLIDASKHFITDTEIEKRISSMDWDEVWLSVGSPEAASEVFRYANIVKKVKSSAKTLVGGIFPSLYPDFFLKSPDIDYLIRGPAEDAIRIYVQHTNFSERKNIQGFCYHDKGNPPHISPEFALTPDLENLPPFDLEGMCIDDYMKSNHFANIQTSRGCPYNCPFCMHARFWGLKSRYRPIANLRKEMRVLQEHQCEAAYIVDSTFTLDINHVKRFNEMYQQERLEIKLAFETRADLFGEEMAQECARFKTLLVWFGGESGSPEVLARLRGKQQGEGLNHVLNLQNATTCAKRNGLLCGSSWVIGLPNETSQTIQETKRVILDLLEQGMDLVDIRILQIFPGTDYYEHPDNWGLKLLIPDDYSEASPWNRFAGHSTENLSKEQIVFGAKELQQAVLQYYLHHRNIPFIMKFLMNHPSIIRWIMRR